jgi:hypothetical protein
MWYSHSLAGYCVFRMVRSAMWWSSLYGGLGREEVSNPEPRRGSYTFRVFTKKFSSRTKHYQQTVVAPSGLQSIKIAQLTGCSIRGHLVYYNEVVVS